MRLYEDYDKYFGATTSGASNSEQSISIQKDLLLKLIEEKWTELMNANRNDPNVDEEINEIKESKKFLNTINETSFTLTKILQSHKIFQPSSTNVVPKTNFLNSFNLELKDADYKNLITYSLINNKIYQAYITNVRNLHIEFHENLIKEQMENKYLPREANLEFILSEISNNYPILVKACTEFIQYVPGYSELPRDYLLKIIKRNNLDFYMLAYSHLLRNGENYVFLSNGFHLTREWLNKIRGKDKTDIQFETAENLNNLSLYEKEKAVLCAYIFSLPDETFSAINEMMSGLHDFYKKALFYELDLNRRNQNFLVELEKVIDKLIYNRTVHNTQ